MGDQQQHGRRKPIKLQEPVTRDSLNTWDLNNRAYFRQNGQRAFLPGGTSAAWTATEDDETHGIAAIVVDGNQDNDATDAARAKFEDFLTTLGTYCPDHFTDTVWRESTSYTWVLEKIKETFSLQTKGVGFLAGAELKFEYAPDSATESFTYQQGFMAIKDFYSSSLLKTGDRSRGKALIANEVLSPMSENFIVERWLDSIDPRLRAHVKNTRGALITAERPTLACIQKQLCEQMKTMLAELDSSPTQATPIINRVGFSTGRGQQGQFIRGGWPGGRGGAGGRGGEGGGGVTEAVTRWHSLAHSHHGAHAPMIHV